MNNAQDEGVNLKAGASISMTSTDDESTPREQALSSSGVGVETGTGSETGAGASTTINMDQVNQSQPRPPRIDINSKLDLFLSRQRSCHMEQQSARSSDVAAPHTAPASGHRLGFWRDMYSMSTSPSPDVLRSLIANSKFCYQPIAGDTLVSQPTMSLNDPSTSGDISDSMRMSSNGLGSSGLGKSSSLPDGDNLTKTHTESALEIVAESENNSTQNAAESSAPFATPTPTQTAENERNIHREMFVESVVLLMRYLPLIFLLLIKFVYDHWPNIFDIFLLQIIFWNLNRTLRLQVARLTEKQYGTLLRDAIVAIVVVAVRLVLATAPPDPFGLIVPPSERITKHYNIDNNNNDNNSEAIEEIVEKILQESERKLEFEPIPLGWLLYHVAVSDLVLRLITIFIKIVLTMLPVNNMKFRGRLYALLEYISQLYRSLTPITQYVNYIDESYPDVGIIGTVLLTLYMFFKFLELFLRYSFLKKAFANFGSNADSMRSPTKDELDAADSMCPICNDPYNSPVILECHHIFCSECVQTWFKREPTCPMCRAKVSDDPHWQDGSTTTAYQLY